MKIERFLCSCVAGPANRPKKPDRSCARCRGTGSTFGVRLYYRETDEGPAYPFYLVQRWDGPGRDMRRELADALDVGNPLRDALKAEIISKPQPEGAHCLGFLEIQPEREMVQALRFVGPYPYSDRPRGGCVSPL